MNNLTMEEELRLEIKETKEENLKLKEKLEITQSVVDEIALGGILQ